jgi:hypothetical protein
MTIFTTKKGFLDMMKKQREPNEDELSQRLNQK